MLTLDSKATDYVSATAVHFENHILCIVLSDGREIRLPYTQIGWLGWLAQATPEQRENWSLEPGGYAVYWEELDDGLEVQHILTAHPLV